MSALRAATRPTLREMQKKPWALLAVILLIAFPVFLASFFITESHSITAATRDSRPTSTLTYQGGTCEQDFYGFESKCVDSDNSEELTVAEETLAIRSHLPSGTEAHLNLNLIGSLTLPDGATSFTQINQIPSEIFPAPIKAALGRELEQGEIILPRSEAERLKLDIGDVIEFRNQKASGSATELTIAGLTPGWNALVVEPTFGEPESFEIPTGQINHLWHLTSSQPVTWDMVRELNTAGIVVYSQDLQDNPPPAEEAYEAFPAKAEQHGRGNVPNNFWLGLYNVLISLVLLLVIVAMIAPVFTISAVRQSRNFALMSSQGATRSHIRQAVLAYGFVAGLVGASIGLLAGVGFTAARWAIQLPGWSISLDIPKLLIIWAAAFVGSLCAAAVPAWVSSRASISAGIQGATPDRMPRWRPAMAIGPVGLIVWLIATVTALFVSSNLSFFFPPLFALVALIFGIASTPALVWVLARLTRSAPLHIRLASRDSARHLLRTAPALSAIIALCLVFVSSLIGVQINDARNHQLDREVYATSYLTLAPPYWSGENISRSEMDSSLAQARSIVHNHQPNTELREYDIYGPADSYSSGAWTHYEVDYGEVHCLGEHTSDFSDPSVAEACWHARSGDSSYGAFERLTSGGIISSGEELDLLQLSAEEKQLAKDALAEGGVVVSASAEHTLDSTGQARIVRTIDQDRTEFTFPAAAVLPKTTSILMFSPDAAQEMDIEPTYLGTTISSSEPLSTRTEQSLYRQAREGELEGNPSVRGGDKPELWTQLMPYGILGGAVLVLITLVLILSAAASKRDFLLIDALGAPPATSWKVTSLFAGLITFVGTTLGALLGIGVAMASAERTTYDVTGAVLTTGTVQFIPGTVLPVLGFIVVSTIGAMLIGTLFHRRKKELAYRET